MLDSRQQRRSKSGLRREDLPFFIARSDLTWAQPWRFQQAASLAELRLRSQGLAALDDAAAAAEGRTAEASFVVQLPSGLGALVVTGSVQAAVPLRCEFCGEAFETAVAERFDGEALQWGCTAGPCAGAAPACMSSCRAALEMFSTVGGPVGLVVSRYGKQATAPVP